MECVLPSLPKRSDSNEITPTVQQSAVYQPPLEPSLRSGTKVKRAREINVNLRTLNRKRMVKYKLLTQAPFIQTPQIMALEYLQARFCRRNGLSPMRNMLEQIKSVSSVYRPPILSLSEHIQEYFELR
jgi:hypothetical protein